MLRGLAPLDGVGAPSNASPDPPLEPHVRKGRRGEPLRVEGRTPLLLTPSLGRLWEAPPARVQGPALPRARRLVSRSATTENVRTGTSALSSSLHRALQILQQVLPGTFCFQHFPVLTH